MVNFSKIIQYTLISTIITLAISFLLLSFIDAYPATYWGLQVLVLLIIGVVFALLLETNLECLLYSTFFSIISFLIFFVFLLLFTSFSEVMLNLLNFGITKISGWGNILKSFVGSIIIGSIILGISLSSTIAAFNIKSVFTKGRNMSAGDIEEQFYSKYEISSDSGTYHRINDKEKYD